MRALSPTVVSTVRPGLAYYPSSPSPAVDRSPSPDMRVTGGLPTRTSTSQTPVFRRPVVVAYRGSTPSPSPTPQGLHTGGTGARTVTYGTSGRDRSSSPDARISSAYMQIHAASPFRQSPPVPLRTSGPSAASATSSRRPLTPDAPPVETRSPMYRNQQPLPTPFRMSREQPGARAALDGQRTIPLPTACSGASSTRGERRSEYIAAPVPGIFGVAETGQRTVTRSASPQAHAPVTAELGQPYYVRSRPHTPFGRSVGQQSSTPGHADPRTPSPATRVVQTKSRPVPRPLQPMAVTHRSAQAIEQGSGSMRRVVTVVRQPGSPLGQGRVSVSPVRQLAQAPNSQNVSPVASAQAMSPHSAAHVLAQGQNGSGCSERARPPQPGPSIPAVAAMGVGTSPSGAPLPPNAELCEGAVLPISSGGTCRVKKPLGMGSFGAVWEAEQSGGGPALALKEILCPSQVDLLNAVFEGNLLESFKTKDPGKLNVASMLPVLVGLDMTPLATDLFRVRLAMTRLPGQPLDTWLRLKQDEAQLQNFSSASLRIQGVGEACRFARELLLQLAPAFEEHIAALAYHRDVNAHNILIDMSEGPKPKYGLVDFGLAVDVQSWRGDPEEGGQERPAPSRNTRVGQDGATSWHHLDVGGDCRYWPVSAWVQFLLGWTELDCNPMLRSEYRTRLDMHSLGLTALQVLVETMPPDITLPAAHSAGEVISEIHKLRSAWERYWAMVTPLHSRLMETFHNGGDWDVLKAHCLDSNVHEVIASKLRSLRAAIIKTIAACKELPNSDPPGFPTDSSVGLLSALLLLIGCGDRSDEAEGTIGPTAEEVPGPAVWRQVRLLIEKDSRLDAAEKLKVGTTSAGKGNERLADFGAPEAGVTGQLGLGQRRAGQLHSNGASAPKRRGDVNSFNSNSNVLHFKAGNLAAEKAEWLFAQEVLRPGAEGDGRPSAGAPQPQVR